MHQKENGVTGLLKWMVAGGLLMLVAGCNDGPALYPVTGSVSLDGKPVDGASVTFISSDGQPVFATTDSSGNYAMLTNGKPGVPVGEYKVTVSKVASSPAISMNTPEDMKKMQAAGPMPKPMSLVPERYASPDKSGLTATVTKDKSKNVFPLNLKP
jgi:hypothetical protein